MDQKQISADRKKYAAQLADVERQASALREMLAALDKLEGNTPHQISLPLAAQSQMATRPVKLTAAVMRVFEENPNLPFGTGEIRDMLERSGFDTSSKKFPVKLGRVLQRQLVRGVLSGNKNNQGRWSYVYTP